MRRLLYICILLIISLSQALPLAAQEIDLPVKQLHEQPTLESSVVYDIPIEVKLLGYTEDRNWYKIKVSFNLGLLGSYTYIGWAKVPIGTDEVSSETRPEDLGHSAEDVP